MQRQRPLTWVIVTGLLLLFSGLGFAQGEPVSDAQGLSLETIDSIATAAETGDEIETGEAAIAEAAEETEHLIQTHDLDTSTSFLQRLTGIIGVFVLMGLAFLMSSSKKSINWRTILVGVGLQFIFALLVLKTPPGRWIFERSREVIVRLLSYADYGAKFMFGDFYLSHPDVATSVADNIAPGGLIQGFQVWDPAGQSFVSLGTIFAFHVLPTIIFFAALLGILYHLGIMQRIVQVFAWVMKRAMGISGAESLSAASNIFVGQTEAPFVVKPYLGKMTLSEIMAVMTGGFATVAGGVMAAYTRFGMDPAHLMAASVMSAPAAMVMAKMIIPETDTPVTRDGAKIHTEKTASNVIDAAASGATDGLKLAVNVAAMLIAFIAIIALLNGILGWVGGLFGFPQLSLKMILGVVFSPIALSIGVSPKDMLEVGYLLGTKVSLNEFVAFIDLAALKGQISDRSFVIATYALCGFANLSSIAIQIGGIAALVPERRKDLAKLGMRAMIAGALASWQTAAIAGILL